VPIRLLFAIIMAMAVLELEGAWEDILRRSAELSGRRVRVTVLADQPTATSLDEAAEAWADGAERLEPGPPGPPRHGEEAELQQILIEKFRKQGLKL
jgi:hypothetical protein